MKEKTPARTSSNPATPRPKPLLKIVLALAALCVFFGAGPFVSNARAATFTWDASGTHASSPTDGAGTWSTSNANWSNGSADADWNNGDINDNAVFGNGSGAAGTVTVSTVSVGNITFNAPGSGSYTLSSGTITLTSGTITTNAASATINSVIAGSAGLSVSGTGTLNLGGVNTYTGGTTLTSGTLSITNASALSSGTVTLSGGTLLGVGTGVNFIPNNIVVTPGTTTTLEGGGGAGYMGFTGAIMGSGTIQSALNAGDNIRFASDDSGFTGTFIDQTGGFVFLNTANSASAAATWQFNAGSTMALASGTYNFGSLTGAGGAISGGGSTSVLSVGALNQNTSYAGTLATLSLVKVGTGTLTLSGNNTFSSGLTVSSGAVAIASINNAGASGPLGANTGVTLGSSGSAGTLEYTGSNTASSTMPFALASSGTGAFQVDGAAGNLTLSGTISGSGALLKTGAGTLTLSGSNTNTGPTTVNTGTLEFGIENSLYNDTTGSWTAANITVASGATLALAVGGAGQFTSSDIGTLSGLGTGTGGFQSGAILGLDTSSATGGSFTETSAIANANGNGLSLSKLGAGTLTLTATNTYTGPTIVKAGTLEFATEASLYNNTTGSWTAPNLIVSSGATLAVGVGGAGQFTGSDIAALAALGTGTSGFLSGASLGIDTTSAGGNFTYGNAIANPNGGSNALGLNKLGTGTLTLTASSSYTGPTTITGGTLQLGSGGTTGALAASSSIVDNATLAFNRSNTVTQGTDFSSSAITGTGSLIQAGSGTLILNVANSYSGGTTIASGTLSITNSTALGSGTLTLSGGTLLGVGISPLSNNIFVTPGTTNTLIGGGGASDLLMTGSITGSGTIQSSKASDNIRFSGNNSGFSGTFIEQVGNGGVYLIGGNSASASATYQLNGGLVVVNGAGTYNLGSLAGSIGIQDQGGADVLSIGALNQSTLYSGVISQSGGTASVTKVGSGTLTLAGANSYAGATTVSAGTLILSGNDTTTGATNVNAGTLIVTSANGLGGTANTSTVALAAGGTLNYIAAADAQLQIGGKLSIAGGTGTVFGGSIGASATSSAFVTSGSTSVTSGAVSVAIYGEPSVTPVAGTNTYVLLQSAAGSNISNGAYSLGNVYNNSNFTVGALAETGTTLTVSITKQTALGTVYWNGGFAGGNNVWTLSDGSTTSNWASSLGGASQALVPGSTTAVVISNTSSSIQIAPTSTVLGANITVGSLTISDSVNGLGLNADGNTLTVATSAGITMNAGAAASTIGANVALGTNETWTNNSANTLTVSGAVTGGAALTTSGTGTIILSGPATYTGATSVGGGGVLQVNSGGSITNGNTLNVGTSGTGGTLTINGGSVSVSGVNVGNAGSAPGTINLSSGSFTNASTTILGVSANGSFVQTGGTSSFQQMNIGQNSPYTGTVTVNGGTLVENGQLNLSANGGNAIVNMNAGTFTDSYASGAFIGQNGGGSASWIQTGGTATFAGQVNVSQSTGVGSISVSGGNFTVTGAGGLDLGINANASLTMSGSGVMTLSKLVLYGNTQTYNFNGGTFNTAALTYSAGTPTFNLNGGTFQAGGALTIPSQVIAKVQTGGAVFDTNGNSITVSTALLTGSAAGGGLTKNGAGTLTLNGASTYTGSTTINSGTAVAGVASVANTSGAFGDNSAVILANAANTAINITGFNTQIGSLTGGGANGGNAILGSATLTVGGDNTSPAAYAGVISGAGGAITKIGSGTLTLTGANTYSGATTINAGTLQVGNGGTAGSISSTSGVSGSSGASLAFDRSDNISPSYSIGGGIGVTQAGSGTLTLSGASLTYTGLTSASAGTLIVAGSISGNVAANGGTLIANSTIGGNGSVAGGILGGAGTIDGNVTVGTGSGGASSSVIEPSVDAAGAGNTAGANTLNIGANLTLNSDAAYNFTLNSTAFTSDALMVSGTLTLNGASTLAGFDAGNTILPTNGAAQFIIAQAADGIIGAFGNAANGSIIQVGQNFFEVNYDSLGGSAEDIVLTATAVPEPGTWAMFVGGIGLLCVYQRRRQTRLR